MYITNEAILHYFDCTYKSHLTLHSVQGEKCNLENFYSSALQEARQRYSQMLSAKGCSIGTGIANTGLENALKQGKDYHFDISLLHGNLTTRYSTVLFGSTGPNEVLKKRFIASKPCRQ